MSKARIGDPYTRAVSKARAPGRSPIIVATNKKSLFENGLDNLVRSFCCLLLFACVFLRHFILSKRTNCLIFACLFQLNRLINPARERMANAASNRRATKNVLLSIKIRQTQLEGQCKLIARQIANDEDSLASITNQNERLQVQKHIAENQKVLEMHSRAMASLPSEAFAAAEGQNI